MFVGCAGTVFRVGTAASAVQSNAQQDVTQAGVEQAFQALR
jgi:hypothetical protein